MLMELDFDVALLQEAPSPPDGIDGHVHLVHFDPRRPWGTAVWSRSLPLTALPSTTSVTAPAWRPGLCAAAEIALPSGGVMTAISLHAVDDRHRFSSRSSPSGYATSTVHHVLSDLTGYLEDGARKGTARGHDSNRLVLGGDLNINPGWDERQGTPAHRLTLDRIEAYGLTSVLPVCSDDAHATCIRSRIPYRQIDYLFASRPCGPTEARVVDSPVLRNPPDHLPISVRLR